MIGCYVKFLITIGMRCTREVDDLNTGRYSLNVLIASDNVVVEYIIKITGGDTFYDKTVWSEGASLTRYFARYVRYVFIIENMFCMYKAGI